jgi:hypothetical protein
MHWDTCRSAATSTASATAHATTELQTVQHSEKLTKFTITASPTGAANGLPLPCWSDEAPVMYRTEF